MATFDELKEVRLTISDPSGIIDIIQIADSSLLPASPAQQTAYRLTDTGRYMSTELESGATATDYVTESLYLSDNMIESLIDAFGVNISVCKCYDLIKNKLGRMLIKSQTAGTTSTTYTDLKTLYDYYKKLADDCAESNRVADGNSTGRYGATHHIHVAGGNL